MDKVLRVYFSFDYERDLHRVRKIYELPDIVTCAPAGFQAAHVWLQARRRGDPALQGLIRDGLNNTNVSVFCVGYMYAFRKFVDFEIEKSLERGNAILALKINHLRDEHGRIDPEGHAPELIYYTGYKIYEYTNKKKLIEHIHEAVEIAHAQQQDSDTVGRIRSGSAD